MNEVKQIIKNWIDSLQFFNKDEKNGIYLELILIFEKQLNSTMGKEHFNFILPKYSVAIKNIQAPSAPWYEYTYNHDKEFNEIGLAASWENFFKEYSLKFEDYLKNLRKYIARISAISKSNRYGHQKLNRISKLGRNFDKSEIDQANIKLKEFISTVQETSQWHNFGNIIFDGILTFEDCDESFSDSDQSYALKKDIVDYILTKIIGIAQIYTAKDGYIGYNGRIGQKGYTNSNEIKDYESYRISSKHIGKYSPLLSSLMTLVFKEFLKKDHYIFGISIKNMDLQTAISLMDQCPSILNYAQYLLNKMNSGQLTLDGTPITSQTLGWTNAAELINEIQRAFGYDPSTGDYLFDDSKINGNRKSFVANTEEWWKNFHNAKNIINQIFSKEKCKYLLPFGQKTLPDMVPFEEIYLDLFWSFIKELGM